MRNRQGSLLIVTLWMVIVMTVFAVGLGHRVSLGLQIVDYQRAEAATRAAARAGVIRAQDLLVQLAASRSEIYDALGDQWVGDPSTFHAQVLANGSGWTVSYDDVTVLGDPVVRYGVQDEERRINLNTVTAEVIDLAGVPSAVAASIAYYRGYEPVSDLNLVEADEIAYYEGLDPPQSPKGAEFVTMEEVWLVRGMTSEIYRTLTDVATVHGSGLVNLNTAPHAVLSAIFKPVIDEVLGGGSGLLSSDLANKVIATRDGTDAEPDVFGETSPDDVPFKDLDAVEPLSREVLAAVISDPPLLDAAVTSLQAGLADHVDVQSQAFRVRAAGRSADGRVRRAAEAVVIRDPDELDASQPPVYWYEE